MAESPPPTTRTFFSLKKNPSQVAQADTPCPINSVSDCSPMDGHEFTDENFDTDVTQSDLPVLIDFWAVWCGPCKAIAPVIEEIAGEYEGQVKVGKVDVDQNQNTAMKFGVRSIPTLLVIKDGEVVNQIVGAVPKGSITDILKEVI